MGHPFDPSFLFVLSFDKGTKSLNHLTGVYHNFLRASRIVVVDVDVVAVAAAIVAAVVAIATASHVERSSSPFLDPLWPCSLS